jgi:hypothetical protein
LFVAHVHSVQQEHLVMLKRFKSADLYNLSTR